MCTVLRRWRKSRFLLFGVGGGGGEGEGGGGGAWMSHLFSSFADLAVVSLFVLPRFCVCVCVCACMRVTLTRVKQISVPVA